jgi:malonyl-CoA O-methyltransferase
LIKAKAKKHFSKSALSYDKNAELQKYMEDKLIGKLVSAGMSAESILDIGAGTGGGALKLYGIHPQANVTACDIAHGMMKHARHCNTTREKAIKLITADMEYLPFKEGMFDIVYSNAAVHWAEDLGRLFGEAKKALKPGGVLCFSTFGQNTLEELVYSFDEAYLDIKKERRDHVNRFASLDEVIIKLKRAGFNDIAIEVEKKRLYYQNVKDLLKKLKAIGSHRNDLDIRFLGRDFFNGVFDIYEKNFKENDKIYATYVVYYLVCKE